MVKLEELKKTVDSLKESFKEDLKKAANSEKIDKIRVLYLGRKGKITSLLKSLKEFDADTRPIAGKILNELKEEIESDIKKALIKIKEEELLRLEEEEVIDVTLPGCGRLAGKRHPVSMIADEVIEIFLGMGFDVEFGPEIEDDYHNFEALNIPKHHPARDMQDTFYFTEDYLLRTHTSPVQIRSMEKYNAPLRIICPGRVYRRDSDPTHSPMFHQLEGLLIDEDVSLADLKGVLAEFAKRMFGRSLDVRFRPSYFPFTEPSLEVDVECSSCYGKGCKVCKGTGWLEILGAGMVHPKVLEAGGIDSKKYRGFAWGMGLDRIAMLKYGITDLRLLFDNDARFLLQSGGVK